MEGGLAGLSIPPAYQLPGVRAIPLGVTRSQPRELPRFAPVDPGALRADDPELLFVPDLRLDAELPGRFVLAPGAALPGRLDGHSVLTHTAALADATGPLRARAVRPDGTLLDVLLTPPTTAETTTTAATTTVPAPTTQPPDFPGAVFVYGTLMRGEEREGAIRALLPDVQPEPAEVAGCLLHLGAWPGLVSGSGRVEGELYRSSDMPALLAQLDPIEDFEGYLAPPTEYVRVVLPVTTARGLQWAFCYLYVGTLEGTVRIPSGRWRDAPRRLPGCPIP